MRATTKLTLYYSTQFTSSHLNRSDQINKEQLVRVYGSLLWSMGKIFGTPEVARVYCGSYWDEP